MAEPSAGSEPPQPARRRLRDSAAGNVAVIVIVTLLVLAGVWLVDRGREGAAAEPEPTGTAAVSTVELTGEATGEPPAEGRPAPDFVTFALDGQDVVLSELRGQPVWLVFGATWCANCRAETPDIQAVHERYGDRAHILAVYVGESISTVGDFADRLSLTYPQIADSYTDIGSAYRVLGLPTHVFIDADGVIDAIEVGTITEQAAADRLDALLGR